jgi:hypothetical protein
VDERALYEKGAIMEMYEPKEPSRHYIDSVGITSVGHKTERGFKIEKNLPPEPILIFVFGKEDTSAARSEGRSMAESHYDRAMAGQFLSAEGWDKYHDRFFTRTYVKEGMDAYEDTTGTELPAPARKTIHLEGRIVKDGVRKAVRERQLALAELVHAVKEYRNIAEGTPLTLQGRAFAHAVLELNKAIERADRLLQ